MAKPTIIPEIFCVDTNYSTLAQRPARNGTPTKVNGGAAWRNEGAKPAEGADAQWFNYDANVWSQYVKWVHEGSDTPDADAHIVETNTAGTAKILTAQLGLGGVAPSTPEVLLVRGQIPALQTGAAFAFTGDSTAEAGLTVQASGRSALSVFTSEDGSDHAYGKYPAEVVRTAGHGIVSHKWNTLPADAKTAFGSDTGFFTAYAGPGDSTYCFFGAGDGRLAKLHRRSGSGAILELRTEDGTETRGLAIYSTNSPAVDGSTTGQSASIYVDTSGSGSDTGPRPTAYIGGRMQDGLVSVTTEPERATWSGAGAAIVGHLKTNTGQTKLADGSAAIMAIRGAGGCGLRVVVPKSGSLTPEFDVPPLETGYDVRIIDEGAQHVSMRYAPDGDLYGFNVGDRFGLTAQKAVGDTRLLRARRGSAGEGYGAESVVTYRGYPIHWIKAVSTTIGLQDPTTVLTTISSNIDTGPTPPMQLKENARIVIKFWVNGKVTTNQNHELTLQVIDNNITTVIHSVPMGIYKETNQGDVQDAFNCSGGIPYTIPADGHRSFSIRLLVGGTQQGAGGDVYNFGLEVIALG